MHFVYISGPVLHLPNNISSFVKQEVSLNFINIFLDISTLVSNNYMFFSIIFFENWKTFVIYSSSIVYLLWGIYTMHKLKAFI